MKMFMMVFEHRNKSSQQCYSVRICACPPQHKLNPTLTLFFSLSSSNSSSLLPQCVASHADGFTVTKVIYEGLVVCARMPV